MIIKFDHDNEIESTMCAFLKVYDEYIYDYFGRVGVMIEIQLNDNSIEITPYEEIDE